MSGGIPEGHGAKENASLAGQSVFMLAAVLDVVDAAKSLASIGKAAVRGTKSLISGGAIRSTKAYSVALEMKLTKKWAKSLSKSERRLAHATEATEAFGKQIVDMASRPIQKFGPMPEG